MNFSPTAKKFLASAVMTATAGMFLFAGQVGAVDTGLENTAAAAGFATGGASPELAVVIGRIVRSLLGFIGVLFVVLFIYAGFLWMTAQGNEEQVTKAKKIISGSVIGMIIIFASYGISNFVVNAVLKGTGVK
jgi:hypothetical protein